MNNPISDASLALGFPAPGPLVEAAYLDLYLATEVDDLEQDAVGHPDLLPRPYDPPTVHRKSRDQVKQRQENVDNQKTLHQAAGSKVRQG